MLHDGWRSLTEPAVHRAGPGGSLLPVVSWSRLPGAVASRDLAVGPRTEWPATRASVARHLQKEYHDDRRVEADPMVPDLKKVVQIGL